MENGDKFSIICEQKEEKKNERLYRRKIMLTKAFNSSLFGIK